MGIPCLLHPCPPQGLLVGSSLLPKNPTTSPGALQTKLLTTTLKSTFSTAASSPGGTEKERGAPGEEHPAGHCSICIDAVGLSHGLGSIPQLETLTHHSHILAIHERLLTHLSLRRGSKQGRKCCTSVFQGVQHNQQE